MVFVSSHIIALHIFRNFYFFNMLSLGMPQYKKLIIREVFRQIGQNDSTLPDSCSISDDGLPITDYIRL